MPPASTSGILDDLADGQRISAIEVCPVPAPAHAEHPGEHLFINCYYSAPINSLDAATGLQQARKDTAAILRRVVDNDLHDGMTSVCISVLATSASGARRRVYRYSALVAEMPDDAEKISEESMVRLGSTMESSEIESVTTLLEERGPDV